MRAQPHASAWRGLEPAQCGFDHSLPLTAAAPVAAAFALGFLDSFFGLAPMLVLDKGELCVGIFPTSRGFLCYDIKNIRGLVQSDL
jgi:hypothetical protein